MKFQGRQYELQLASSLPDDGMLLELIDGPRENGEIETGRRPSWRS